MYMYKRTGCEKGCVIGSFLLHRDLASCRQAHVISFIPCYACDFVDDLLEPCKNIRYKALCYIVTDLVEYLILNVALALLNIITDFTSHLKMVKISRTRIF